MNLEKFLEKHQSILLAISIFLLVTITLLNTSLYLNSLLALLSALITYLLLIGIDLRDNNKNSWQLSIFKIIFSVFVVAFCGFVILNIVIKLTGELEKMIWIVVWLILMIYPSIKWFSIGANTR